jgi:hypothetical protein
VYGGSRSIVPIILYLGTRRKGRGRVFNFMPQQLYRSRKNPLYLLNDEAGWAAEGIWTVWIIEKVFCPCLASKPNSKIWYEHQVVLSLGTTPVLLLVT